MQRPLSGYVSRQRVICKFIQLKPIEPLFKEIENCFELEVHKIFSTATTLPIKKINWFKWENYEQ